MPPRSNLFQRVVYLIQGHLSEGSVVTESAMLKDRITGAEREVDVLIDGTIGGHSVLIAIECRDHARRQSVTWVEEMYAKHLRLPTHALLLVSASGFTEEAKRVAEAYGIELVVPGAADEHAARSTVGRAKSLWFKQLDLTPASVMIQIEAEDGSVIGNETAISPQILDAEGNAIAELFDAVKALLSNYDATDVLRDATGVEDEFEMLIEAPTTVDPSTGASDRMYVRTASDRTDHIRRVRALHVKGTARVIVAQVPLVHGDMSGTPFAYGEAPLEDRDLLLVVTEPTDEERKVTFQFTPRNDSPPLGRIEA